MISVDAGVRFQEWQATAAELLAKKIHPHSVVWRDGEQASLFQESFHPRSGGATPLRIDSRFMQLAERVACLRERTRWTLLYRVLWRLSNGEPALLSNPVDPDALELYRKARAVDKDIHKMHAFVRFKRVVVEGEEQYVAWYAPEHRVLRLAAPFFVRRFGSQRWAILTPDESVYWDKKMLRYGKGVPQSAVEAKDELEDLWRIYYSSVFNPARVRVRAMKKEMPVRHWSSLPETRVVQQLLTDAPKRVREMEKNRRPAAQVSPLATLPELAGQAFCCTACPLHRGATQTVFGEGPDSASIVFVGEQPGDQEDLAGRPFVGPAGEILNEAFRRAGLEREKVYLTNAVKHFKWIPHGKGRLHQKPDGDELHACKPWLAAELARIKPKLVVCLGATAAHAVLGQAVPVEKSRGRLLTSPIAPNVLVTYHPSAVLRVPGEAAKQHIFEKLVSDLVIARTLDEETPASELARAS